MNRNRTLIHLESDPAFTQAAVECLQNCGINVVLVQDPAALIAGLIVSRHRVVLLDIDAPGVDGLELLREIKRNDGCTQVIVATGSGIMASLIQLFRTGAEACFLKPLATMEPLVEAVADAFRKTERWWECLRDVANRRRASATAPSIAGAEAECESALRFGDNGPKPFAENRRQWTRYRAAPKQITVVADGCRQAAVVVDESFGGIGLLMDSPANLCLHREIALVYQGVAMQGIVRRMQPERDGKYRVGIQWLRSLRESSERPAAANGQDQAYFLPFCGLRLACRVVGDLADNAVCVRLPNDSEQEIQKSTLCALTWSQRQQELEQLGHEVTMLLGIYELGKQESREAAIRAILALEYGDSWKVAVHRDSRDSRGQRRGALSERQSEAVPFCACDEV